MAEEVHPVTEGQGSRLAVIDSGIYDDHPDLDDRVIPGLSKNFTDDGEDYRPNGAGDHGTHVAGIIAATDDYDGERGGVLGTAPKSKLLSLRVFSDTGGASTGDVAAAIMHAADKNCDAANISLGYPVPYVDPEEYPFLLDVLEVYERAVAYANERGTVVVNSAGNDAIDLDPEGTLGVPTEAEGIFAVSATGPIGYVWDDPLDPPVDPDRALQPEYLREPTTQPARYTTYGGSVVDVSAAGGNYDLEALAEADDGDDDTPKWFYDLVISTVTPEDGEPGYGFKAGTSMAAPQVTGAIGLARSLRPQIGVREVEELIRDTADDLGEPDYRGDGHLDVTALVEELARGERGGRGKGRDDDHPGRGKAGAPPAE
jgi:subtilisin family serine protease